MENIFFIRINVFICEDNLYYNKQRNVFYTFREVITIRKSF